MKRLLALVTVLLLALGAVPALAEETPAPEQTVLTETAQTPAPEEAALTEADAEKAEETPEPEGPPDDTEPADLIFTLPESCGGYDWRLTDGVVMSRVPLEAGESITAAFMESKQGAYIQWYVAPASGTLTQLDGAGTVISQEQVTFPAYLNLYGTLDPACRQVTLTVNEACALSEVTFYGAEETLPARLQQWQPTAEKADLMLVVSDPGAEFSEFSGLLPLYAGDHAVATTVVYMTTCERRSRAEEALTGLWAAGVRTYPVFLEKYARNYDLLSIVEHDWDEGGTVEAIQGLIERCQPAVVVTHNPSDTGDAFPIRGFTARCTRAAAQASAWQVQKLYMYDPAGEAGATKPDFTRGLSNREGATAAQYAQTLYAGYATRQVYARLIDEAPAFLLESSQVGEDGEKNDLLEHIDLATLTRYETPAPMAPPTAAAEGEGTAAPDESQPEPPVQTAEPAPSLPTPSPRLSPAVAPTPQNATLGKLLPVVGGILLTILLLVVLRRFMDRWWAIILSFTPAVAGIAVYLFVLGGTLGLDTTNPKKVAQTPPTPAPTAAPTPTPTASPIPASVIEPAYFRAEGEPDEVVVYDSEHGHWEYRTDLLGIYIDRIQGVTKEDKPLTYFVADIYMKDVNQFRPAFGSDGHTGRGAIFPWITARRAKAVLWITGDNMINSDRDEKGVIIRDGRLFLDEEVEDTMAIYPDMSLRIYKKWNQDADAMLDDGVENTFSFGPTLVENGSLNLEAYKHRVRRANPRVGIGMVEPGHYVAIVVDGRQKEYSVGLKVEDFAEMFLEYDCVTAYNMDGGLSAGMIFMGEQLNSHSGQRTGSKNDLSYQRPVPDGLIFGYSDRVPDVDDPIQNDGNLVK